jgi:hypothetical protein
MEERIKQSKYDTDELPDMPVNEGQADATTGGPASDLATWRTNFGVTI